MRLTAPGGAVEVSVADDRAVLVVDHHGELTRLVLAPADGPRMRLLLETPPLRRPLDVSRTPGVVAAALERVACPGADIADVLGSVAARAGAWHASGADVSTAVGGAVFPLLGAVYDRGAAALPAVPPWAATGLTAPTCAEAARTWFGAKATRPVVAALATSLPPAPGGLRRPALAPLFLALAGRDLLEPDQLAAVLTGAASCPDDCSARPSSDVDRVARLLAPMRRHDATALLVDVAGQPHGVDRLVACALDADDLGPERPHHLPARLRHAEDRLARLRARRDVGVRRHRRAERGSTWLLGELDGREIGEAMRLRRPAGATELRAWALWLHNCLADYVAPVTEGRTILVGVEKADHLAYCLELSPDRAIRQFLGRDNGRVPDDDATTVLEALDRHGVLSLAAPANVAWLAAHGYSRRDGRTPLVASNT